MKRIVLILSAGIFLLTSCNQYNNVLKSADYEYKYEAAKEYFVKGQYSRAALLFGDLIAVMKGTVRAQESLYMLAMSEYCDGNYDVASSYFKKYYQSYPKGTYVEYARYYAGRSLYESVPDVRLDQTNTYTAIKEFQDFLDLYPYTKLKDRTQDMIYALQDKLVEKEYISAKLYYDLGNYMGNCLYGGSNYEACIVTAQNALLDYPYASPARREEFAIMILRAKYHLARQSVEDKRMDRYRDAIDEYYGFVNEYPESKYLKDAQQIFVASDKVVNKK
ncbi:MAG TPA: outer membrane protein assembly factor BamD [Candidatus Paraprevotella stercorigallinarum]|jgi:outer membrane protein assembly factor BamD|nr:outer membrane protein assembly factor BamD [Candidatus Paraprevotella stercorigallinarum]